MNRLPYPSDLTDPEWRRLEPLLPPPQPGGRPIKYPRREIVNAVLYILRTGAAWRLLPHAFPPYRIVFHYYRIWRKAGVWQQVNDALRQQLRQSEGRHPEPSAAIIDRQSVKTTEKGGRAVTMPAKKCWAASAISWWIRRGCCWRQQCIRRMCRIGTARGWYWGNWRASCRGGG